MIFIAYYLVTNTLPLEVIYHMWHILNLWGFECGHILTLSPEKNHNENCGVSMQVVNKKLYYNLGIIF